MLTDSVRHRALEAIHHLVDDIPPWNDVLEAMCKVIGGESATFILLGADDDLLAMHQWNVDPRAHAEYAAHHFQHDIVAPRTLDAPVGTWFDTTALFTTEELSRSAYYADFLCRYDMRQMLTWIAEQGPTRRGAMSIQRSHPGAHAHRQIHTETTRLLTDQIQRSMNQRKAGAATWVATAESAFDNFNEALLLLNGSGRVQHLSPVADRLLATPGGLAVRQGKLSHDAPTVRAALATGIRRAASSAERVRLIIPLKREGDGQLLDLVRAPPALGIAGETMLLGRLQTRNTRAVDLDRLMAAFDITPAEARVLAALCAGQTPQQHATSQALSVHTVRKQIAVLMDKMGCARQVDLVRKGLAAQS
ncbi:MAG: helix-turn-helix transcriptional regulator [Comamonadaceae bacterium]|nr:MAG: helix-turn-helix transcriptional regulator [Comamonadaceae bacterium]